MKRTEALHLKVRGYIRKWYDCVQCTKLRCCVESIAWMVILFLLLELTQYEVCDWLVFVFYYHCRFMYSWNIDCLCTLRYTDANLIHIKDCPYWNF